MKLVLWELHSGSDMPARCVYHHDSTTEHLITVTVGDVERFSEPLTTEVDALDEAAHLLADFMSNGWNDVTCRDPRIALP